MAKSGSLHAAGPFPHSASLHAGYAERGRYPAISVLKSVSRTMPRAADPAFLPVINRARQVMATYADMES
jgi:flagellar biosynthesis/type III secretory pathway ATPase